MSERTGNKPLMVRLRPDTIAAVKAEALRRAAERGNVVASTSEIVQEALDAFLKREAPKKRR